ncbi:hypothetical protein GMSM_10500 [Geomonas sp. Red276]
MPSPFEGTTFLVMWALFFLLMCGGLWGFFLWAIRSGQFEDQDRARYLPLESGIPKDGDEQGALATKSGRPQP